MNLLFDLDEASVKALALAEQEKIWYCVPVDLSYDNEKKQAGEVYAKTTYLTVTNLRFAVITDAVVTAEFRLKDCEKIKCEHQVFSGIITVTGNDKIQHCVARFSMKDIVRVAYVARGAQNLIEALKNSVTLNEENKVVSFFGTNVTNNSTHKKILL